MESKKQLGSSSSSFTADLFGSKEPAQPPAPAGKFASVFPPPSRVVDGNFSSSEFPKYMQKQFSGDHVWQSKRGISEIAAKSSKGERSISNEERNSIFQERLEPCPLSSSICYGGQEDMYEHSSGTQTSGPYPLVTKAPAEDDPSGNNSNCAYRGNWWQGSLYY